MNRCGSSAITLNCSYHIFHELAVGIHCIIAVFHSERELKNLYPSIVADLVGVSWLHTWRFYLFFFAGDT